MCKRRMTLVVLWKGKGELYMRTFKRVTLLLIFCLVLLGCQAALADATITPVPADRIQVFAEPGLEFKKVEKQDGNLHLQVDSENTDWPTVLGYGGLGEGGTGLAAGISFPTNRSDAQYYICIYMNTNTPTYAEALEAAMALEEDAQAHGGTAYWPIDRTESESISAIHPPYREYNMQASVLSLYEVNDPGCAVVFYFDAYKQPLFAESLRCTLDFTSDQSRKVTPESVSLSLITPDTSVDGITCELTAGELVYTIDDPTVITISEQYHSLQTIVKVPEGTKEVVKYGYWGDVEDTITPDADGKFVIGTSYVSDGQLFEGMDSEKCSYAFMDQNGTILEGGGLLYVTLVNESGNKLALNFQTDWKPIPSNRFRYTLSNDNSLLKLTYEDALAHLSTKEQTGFTEADARKLPLATRDYEVQAPEGAKSYRIAALGGENCFGPAAAKDYQEFLNAELQNQSVLSVKEGQWVSLLPSGWSKNVFYPASTSQKGIELYAVVAESGIGRASFIVVEWFADEDGKESLGVEWFGENADPLTLKPNTYVVSDAAQVSTRLDGPALVYQNGDVVLYAEYRVQSGEQNAYVIDLTLKDLDGFVIEDFSRLTEDGAVEFLIPYPQGLSADSDYTYTVTHYLDDDLKQSESVLEMSVETGGIRFKVTSLSPFELSWEGNAPVPTTPSHPTVTPNPQTPPQTGDNAHILLWCSLCLVSLAAAAALLKKHRKA